MIGIVGANEPFSNGPPPYDGFFLPLSLFNVSTFGADRVFGGGYSWLGLEGDHFYISFTLAF
jgi:hypothetical protein